MAQFAQRLVALATNKRSAQSSAAVAGSGTTLIESMSANTVLMSLPAPHPELLQNVSPAMWSPNAANDGDAGRLVPLNAVCVKSHSATKPCYRGGLERRRRRHRMDPGLGPCCSPPEQGRNGRPVFGFDLHVG